MFLYRMAYRHANGEVEGFQGCGFSEEAAQRDASRRVNAKCDSIGEPFLLTRCVNTRTGLTAEEMRIVKADWASEE